MKMSARINQTKIEQIAKKWRIETEMKKEQKKIIDLYHGLVIFC